ncbi:AAA family ATPase [Streptomyces sp. NPDC048191]|uniref:ATP-binding protein n=1 Tax=Streptomyces sp. NPDC048191 TaxID=3155484 RepID=UPI0033E54DAE
MARLTQLVRSAIERGHGVVELLGDPGSGKTRLLDAVARDARRSGVWVLRARCSVAEGDVAFHPFLQALNAWTVSPDGNRDDEAIGRARALTRALGECIGSAEEIPPWDFFFEQRRLLSECLASAPAGGLLVLDDVQWADAWSIKFLEILIRWPLEEPLAIAVAYRPRQSPVTLRAALQEGHDLGYASTVHLDPLTIRQCAVMLDEDPASPELARLHREGEGNPLYVVALAENEAPRPGNSEAWAYGPLGARLLTELTRLDSDARLVAHAASVLGETFDASIVAAVAQIDLETAARALGELRRHDVVRLTDNGMLSFRHPLVRHCLYGCTGAWWRSDAHRRAFAHLTTRGESAMELAPHIEGAGAEDVAAVQTLIAAADTALHSGKPDLAARWLVAALRSQRILGGGAGGAQVGTGVWRGVLQAIAAKGDRERVLSVGTELLTAFDEDSGGTRVNVAATMACLQASLGDVDSGRALIASQEARLVKSDPAAAAVSHVFGQLVNLLAGVVPDRSEVEGLARWLGDAGPVEAFGIQAIRALCAVFDGDIEAGRRLLAACTQALVGCPAPSPDTIGLAEFLIAMAWAEALVGHYGAAQTHAQEAQAALHKTGDTHQSALVLTLLSYVHYQAGRLPDAFDTAQQAHAAARGIGRQDYAAAADALMAAASARPGEHVPRPEGADDPADENFWGPVTSILRAEAVLAAGDSAGALDVLLPWETAWRRSGPARVHEARGYELLAAGAGALGDQANAERWAARAADVAAAVGLRESRGHALLARGHALQAAEAEPYYQAAWEVLGGDGPARARANALAAGTEGRGRTGESAGPGREAAVQEPAGLPVRDDEGAPLVSLTTREREVARLAGEGLKTKDIATRLGVSPRTVDAHLARIYSKVGVRTRAELVRKVFFTD